MAERIDVARLGELLRRVRLQRGLTLRGVKEATGISIATLSRIERGAAKDLKSPTLLTLTTWLGTAVERLRERPAVVAPAGRVAEDTPEIVELHLRADKKLDKKTATALSRMFRVAYEELTRTRKGEKG